MIVRHDNSETLTAAKWASESLQKEIRAIMRSAVRQGAAFELQNKTYVRRTGNADRSTKGRIDRSSGNEVFAELIINADYASYLSKKGLTAFNESGVRTRDQIQDGFDGLRSDASPTGASTTADGGVADAA